MSEAQDIWDYLEMQGPCDLSYLDALGDTALEQSLLNAASGSPIFNIALLRATAQIFAESQDTPSCFDWLEKEVICRKLPQKRAAS